MALIATVVAAKTGSFKETVQADEALLPRMEGLQVTLATWGTLRVSVNIWEALLRVAVIWAD